MELYTIEVREFKNIFFASLTMMIVFIVASWLWVFSDFVRLQPFDLLRRFSSPILIGMMVLAIFYSSHRRKKLKEINTLDDFPSRVKAYQKVYRLHNGWFVLSCFISCVLFVATVRNFFFYFALLELLITLTAYPSVALFRRDLKNKEFVLY